MTVSPIERKKVKRRESFEGSKLKKIEQDLERSRCQEISVGRSGVVRRCKVMSRGKRVTAILATSR